MSGLLSLLAVVGLLAALVGVCRGQLRSLGLSTRGQCLKAAAVAVVVLVLAGALAPETAPPPPEGERVAAAAPPASRPSASPASPAEVAAPAAAPADAPAAVRTTPPARPSPPPDPLLQMASGGDGDSWRDTTGVEYRMGLINTPELDECGGPEAKQYRLQALATGFRARTYATDRYGRRVSVVVAPDGVNLNVAMARDGIADDTYLERFRHENPSLAAQLDVAFREARTARRGIWTACAAPAPAAPQPVAPGRCHPDYEPCIPVRGDGSGRGAENDLDCSDLDTAVRLRQIGVDPYRLDGRDQDGRGCE